MPQPIEDQDLPTISWPHIHLSTDRGEKSAIFDSLDWNYHYRSAAIQIPHNAEQMLNPIPPGPSSIENDTHGIKKLLLKNSSKLNKFLHSEVNQIIQEF